jgi:hypothetical protein
MRVSDEAALRDEIGTGRRLLEKIPERGPLPNQGLLTGSVSGAEFNDGLDALLS